MTPETAIRPAIRKPRPEALRQTESPRESRTTDEKYPFVFSFTSKVRSVVSALLAEHDGDADASFMGRLDGVREKNQGFPRLPQVGPQFGAEAERDPLPIGDRLAHVNKLSVGLPVELGGVVAQGSAGHDGERDSPKPRRNGIAQQPGGHARRADDQTGQQCDRRFALHPGLLLGINIDHFDWIGNRF